MIEAPDWSDLTQEEILDKLRQGVAIGYSHVTLSAVQPECSNKGCKSMPWFFSRDHCFKHWGLED